MDQCADRSRAFHRIRQPDVQRELSRLPHCAAENQERNKRGARAEHGKTSLLQTTVATIVKEKRAAAAVKPEQAKDKSQVADASGNERFSCRRCGAWSHNPQSNEQIGRQSNHLPADKQKKQAVRDNEPEHRTGEKRKISEKAHEIFVAGHVTSAEDEDAKPDQRDHHQHDGREWIEEPSQTQRMVSECEPGEILNDAESRRLQSRQECEERQYERGDLSSDREYSCAFVPSIGQAQDH